MSIRESRGETKNHSADLVDVLVDPLTLSGSPPPPGPQEGTDGDIEMLSEESESDSSVVELAGHLHKNSPSVERGGLQHYETPPSYATVARHPSQGEDWQRYIPSHPVAEMQSHQSPLRSPPMPRTVEDHSGIPPIENDEGDGRGQNQSHGVSPFNGGGSGSFSTPYTRVSQSTVPTSTSERNPWQKDEPVLCQVCKSKPRYSKYGRSYETCGLTCAAKLEEQKRRCPVCKEKPRATGSAGTLYPTCGFRCSAKLNPPAGSHGMCEQCGIKPKAVSTATRKPYPHCGTACRDKAASVRSEDVVKGKCNTCIVCWKEQSRNQTWPVCMTGCIELALGKAPTIIEVPRGHARYYTVSDQFEKEWDTRDQERPTIRHIYFIVPNQHLHDRFAQFKDHLGQLRFRAKHLNEHKLWMGTSQKCQIGDSGMVDLCSKAECKLCNILMNGVVPQTPNGAQLFGNSNRADNMIPAKGKERTARSMFLTDVISEKEVEMTIEQFMNPATSDGTHGHSFIRIVKRGKFGTTHDTGQLCVYVQDAILPRYLVVYS
ncbi:hypothetical protein CC2G_002334 [Coprinopsis cinerea AmutBmut pab1-1]|nr:hypothetical protein CC2G_002334 [Coprinopsis cinerea AmutBmut pab1-1]